MMTDNMTKAYNLLWKCGLVSTLAQREIAKLFDELDRQETLLLKYAEVLADANIKLATTNLDLTAQFRDRRM